VLEGLEAVCKNKTELKYHYRNCPEICRLADCLAKVDRASDKLETTCNYNVGHGKGSVMLRQSANYDEMADAILRSLKEQLIAYPEEMLGVLGFKRESVLEIWKRLKSSEVGAVSCVQMSGDGRQYVAFAPEHRVCFGTIAGAKGLEFRTLHLIDLEKLNGPLQRNVAYTAITRAKTSLTIHNILGLPRFLRSAVSQFEEPKPLPSVKSLFQQ
jgi:superfamily I DNA/RNA helicase